MNEIGDAVQVADNMVVSLEYTLRLGDGEVVDSSEDDAPLAFIQGHGQIISGLEDALYGMGVGQEKDVVVSPDQGYGQRDPNAMQRVERGMFPSQLELTSGAGIPLRDQAGRRFVGYVVEVNDDNVLLDFNHPLAGETLHFHVKVMDLREATEEDLAPHCGSGCQGCGSSSSCC
ncbi:MAG: peptidylprolyl isomerase [Anaerolineales bacterium]|nr:peptidylprolyl isomerase [Anaerolineales bacterium]